MLEGKVPSPGAYIYHKMINLDAQDMLHIYWKFQYVPYNDDGGITKNILLLYFCLFMYNITTHKINGIFPLDCFHTTVEYLYICNQKAEEEFSYIVASHKRFHPFIL